MHSNHPQGQDEIKGRKRGTARTKKRREIDYILILYCVWSVFACFKILLYARSTNHMHGSKRIKPGHMKCTQKEPYEVSFERSVHWFNSQLSMSPNLALELTWLSCAVIVDIVEIIYANSARARLWMLIWGCGRCRWFGQTLKTKSPDVRPAMFTTSTMPDLCKEASQKNVTVQGSLNSDERSFILYIKRGTVVT